MPCTVEHLLCLGWTLNATPTLLVCLRRVLAQRDATLARDVVQRRPHGQLEALTVRQREPRVYVAVLAHERVQLVFVLRQLDHIAREDRLLPLRAATRRADRRVRAAGCWRWQVAAWGWAWRGGRTSRMKAGTWQAGSMSPSLHVTARRSSFTKESLTFVRPASCGTGRSYLRGSHTRPLYAAVPSSCRYQAHTGFYRKVTERIL